MRKRLLSAMMSIVLAVGLAPTPAFADAPDALQAAPAAFSLQEGEDVDTGIYDLTWGPDGGGHLTGGINWKCTNDAMTAFDINAYRRGDGGDEKVLSIISVRGSTDDPMPSSYYLPSMPRLFESGRYYFTVQACDGTSPYGKVYTPYGKVYTSADWEFTNPGARLEAPQGVALRDGVLTWTVPAANENTRHINKYAYALLYSRTEFTNAQLAQMRLPVMGQPSLTADEGGASIMAKLSADRFLSKPLGDAPYTSSLNMYNEMSHFISKGDFQPEEGYYYLGVYAITDDMTTIQTSPYSQVVKGTSSDIVGNIVTGSLAAIESTVSGDALVEKVRGIDTKALLAAMENEKSVDKLKDLEGRTGVSVTASVSDQVSNLFDAGDVSIVGASFNPLAAGNADKSVKLEIGAAAAGDLADSLDAAKYDKSKFHPFSMTLDGVSDKEHLDVPVCVTLPVPEDIDADKMRVLHYEGGKGNPTEIVPRIGESAGKPTASILLTGFSDFSITEAIGAAAPVEAVAYDANGGSGSMGPTKGVSGGSVKLAENSFAKDGWEFVCWNSESDGSGYSYLPGSTYAVPNGGSPITLYAQWREVVQTDEAASGPQKLKDNPMRVSVAKKAVKAKALKKAGKTVKAITVKGAVGKVSYAKVAKGSSKKLSVNAKTGKVTVKRGTKKGAYKVNVRVSAAGDGKYSPAKKTVTVKVSVK